MVSGEKDVFTRFSDLEAVFSSTHGSFSAPKKNGWVGPTKRFTPFAQIAASGLFSYLEAGFLLGWTVVFKKRFPDSLIIWKPPFWREWLKVGEKRLPDSSVIWEPLFFLFVW